ncbi:MAG: hypothetical protein C5B53_11490 [Candidatus Melainabacteria bacterium]|nr:MAG: hypothetical protein C5B53_11490 [Candidatus Melainabacteria bacterium]
MEKRVKVSIIDNSVKRLTALLLWLDQFRQIQVNGILAESDSNAQDKVPFDCQIILLSEDALGLCDRFLERTLKLGAARPVLVLLTDSRTSADRPTILDGEIKIDMDASLKDLYDQIESVAVSRKLMVSPTWLPAAKAS